MAFSQAVRQLVLAASSCTSQSKLATHAAAATQLCVRGIRTSSAAEDDFSKKDVISFLQNRDDPEVDSAIKAYMRSAFANAGKGAAAEALADPLDLTARIERKYTAAQIVESGIQGISVPLSWQAEGSTTPIKRFVSQLISIGAKAGFEEPGVELEKKLAESVKLVDSVKELLGRIKPYCSVEFFEGLQAAAGEAEAETGATVLCDPTSAGYKKFTDKVKALAKTQGIPWQMLLALKQSKLDEEGVDQLKKEYKAWQMTAMVSDFQAEIEGLKNQAVALVDSHLSKTAEQVRKEQEAALAQVTRRLESSRGTKWATKMAEDLKYISWFDASVAANPVKGPVAA